LVSTVIGARSAAQGRAQASTKHRACRAPQAITRRLACAKTAIHPALSTLIAQLAPSVTLESSQMSIARHATSARAPRTRSSGSSVKRVRARLSWTRNAPAVGFLSAALGPGRGPGQPVQATRTAPRHPSAGHAPLDTSALVGRVTNAQSRARSPIPRR